MPVPTSSTAVATNPTDPPNTGFGKTRPNLSRGPCKINMKIGRASRKWNRTDPFELSQLRPVEQMPYVSDSCRSHRARSDIDYRTQWSRNYFRPATSQTKRNHTNKPENGLKARMLGLPDSPELVGFTSSILLHTSPAKSPTNLTVPLIH